LHLSIIFSASRAKPFAHPLTSRAMVFNWNGFSAFNNTLDSTFLRRTPGDLNADIRKLLSLRLL
jgi:hypothetical protein